MMLFTRAIRTETAQMITATNDGTCISIKVHKEASDDMLYQIKAELKKVPGVDTVTVNTHERLFALTVANPLFDSSQIMSYAGYLVCSMIERVPVNDNAPVRINVKPDPDFSKDDKNWWTVETDRQHLDRTVLDKIKARTGVVSVNLMGNYYNFHIRLGGWLLSFNDEIKANWLNRTMRCIMNEFYGNTANKTDESTKEDPMFRRNQNSTTANAGAKLVTTSTHGFYVNVKINKELPNGTIVKIRTALLQVHGVSIVGQYSRVVGFSAYIANELFDIEQIASQIERTILGILEDKPVIDASAMRLNITKDSTSCWYWNIETDYRHTDGALLDEFRKVTFIDNASFDRGGYNIRIRTNTRPIEMECDVHVGCCDRRYGYAALDHKVRRILDAFYGIQPEPEPFRAERYHKREHMDSLLVIATNHRFTTDEQKQLTPLLNQVPGVYSANFQEGGYNYHCLIANSLFDRNQVAAQVTQVLTDFATSQQS